MRGTPQKYLVYNRKKCRYLHFFAISHIVVEWLYIFVAADNCSTLKNFILEGKLCFNETISIIMNFILEGKMKPNGYINLFNNYEFNSRRQIMWH